MEPEWGQKERREWPRRGCLLNRGVAAKADLPGQGRVPILLYLVDLSEGGMRINLDRKLPENEPFVLTFEVEDLGLASTSQLTLRCQVAWQRSLLGEAWVVGLQFLELTTQDEALLQETLGQFDTPNRRLRFRLRSVVPVSVRFEDDWFYMTATELSPEGMRIRTTPVPWLAVGSQIPLWIHLGSEWPLEPMDAVVLWRDEIWRDRIEVGLRFLDVEEDDARTIQDYIARTVSEEPASSSSS